MPLTINLLLKDKQGTKHIRQTFEKATAQCNITGQAKWIMELNIPGNFNWSKIYTMATQCKLDARLRYFNFQVLHRTLTTNKALKLYNIAESNTCGNCPEIDTISHRLYNCNTIQPLWSKLTNWTKKYIRDDFSMERPAVLVGDCRNPVLVNMIIIIPKNEIHKCKNNQKQPTLTSIIYQLKRQFRLEEFSAVTHSTNRTFLGKCTLYNVLKTG